MDGKSESLLPMNIWRMLLVCAWIRPLLERMDLLVILCEMFSWNAHMGKNERVTGYKQNLVPFIRLFEFGNETELIRIAKEDKHE